MRKRAILAMVLIMVAGCGEMPEFHEFNCKEVRSKGQIVAIFKKCENDEIVCYQRGGGLSCLRKVNNEEDSQ